MHRPHQFSPPWIEIFEGSPCPWFKKQLASFHYFTNLPAELQHRIWKFAVEAAGHNVVYVADHHSCANKLFKCAIPSQLLYAYFDSRMAAVKRWKPALQSELETGMQVYFDAEKDFLVIMDLKVLDRVAAIISNPLVYTPDSKKLKFVMLYVPDDWYSSTIAKLCSIFPNLEEIQIVEPNRGPAYPHILHLSHRTNYNLYCNQHASSYGDNMKQNVCRLVRGIIEKQGRQFKGWEKMPTMVVGTIDQWKRNDPLCDTHSIDIFSRNIVSSEVVTLGFDPFMDWKPEFGFPMLNFEPRVTNDFQALAFAHQRNQKLDRNESWVERRKRKLGLGAFVSKLKGKKDRRIARSNKHFM